MRYEDIDIADLVLYEDNHLLIVNKPAGILSQTDNTGDPSIIELCAGYIKEKYDKPGKVFIRAVQRLDRPVSGCIILTRTSKATERMSKIIRDRKINKIYHAICTDQPPIKADRLEHYLIKNPKNNKVTVYRKPKEGAKHAILSYKLQKEISNHKLIQVVLETGRTHQIRAQLSYIGCPIEGDLKYGSKSAQKDKSICLHSREVTFIHPVKKTELTVTADYPDNPTWQLFA